MITSSVYSVTGTPQELSTRTRLFSTRRVRALQVRDLDFVRSTGQGTYRGTGADSRVGLASAPAFPIQVAVSNLPDVAFLVNPAEHSRPSLSCSSVSVTV